ncbi:MAG: serine/threonine protein kinase [Actinobacteria bacterium]|nr:MAG: serine/threonine protein kinase [Actinomycetota bacterium]
MTWNAPTSARELAVGDVFGPYRLEALLGEGGMGLVFRAVREGDDAEVALKLLKVDLAEDDTFKRRFIHEARSAAEVTHENLVPILDAGEIGGRPYLAVGYVAGETLDERVKRDGALPLEAVLRLAEEVGSALNELHDRGLVHRDIKASNIIVAESGEAMLTDFGLAKGQAYTVLTRPGQVLGTLDYLAPELIRGHPATPASDIYALGCTVYECAAGKTPFADQVGFQKGIAHLEETPPDPGAERDDWSPALSAALLATLAKEPSDRPQSANEFASALRAAATQS